MKTVLTIAGVGVVLFVLYRVAAAAHAGASVISSLKHPTVDPKIATFLDNPSKTQSRSGSGHF